MSERSRTKRILVTGGAGFIGWRACKMFADAGHSVAIADNLHVGMPMPTDPRMSLHEVDIRDEQAMEKVFASFKPDTVVHLAAIHHIPTCELQRAYAQDVNIIGTEKLLQLAQDHDVTRFVLASSGAVYEWVDAPLQEADTPLRACDNYALCKIANELQVQFWAERGEREGRVARIFNTIGHDDPNAHLIPDILNQLYGAKETVTIKLGNLAPKRDYIHANDTAAGIVALTLNETAGAFDIMNVGSGQEASVEDLVRGIGKAMGVTINIESDPARVRRVDRLRQLADVTKLSSATGWRAEVPLSEALQDIVANFAFAEKQSA